MERVILLLIITIEFIYATEYRLIHLKKGGRLNVREAPVINSATLVGTIPADGVGIKIRECKYAQDGKEWCYISYPMGAEHLDGWVRRYYLEAMEGEVTSPVYIKTFLKNYYKSDEKNFLDKLKRFYHFPMQQYFHRKNVNLIQLRTAKVSFYKKWSIRNYQLVGFKILKGGDDYIDIQTVVKWRLKNKDETTSGMDTQKVRLILENGGLRVLAIKNLTQTINLLEESIADINETIDNNLTVTKQFYVKVGSFFSNPNENYLLNISKNGFNYIIQNSFQNGDIIIKRVYIGPYSSKSEAKRMLKIIKVKINKNAYIQSF